MNTTHISAAESADLVRDQIRQAQAARACHIRDADAFQAHLIAVAERAESIAGRLCEILPPDEAPDPVAAFVAGVWHDGGKIWNGDDYHEITSAIEILDRGIEWGLVRGAADDRDRVLCRAARALVPHFAVYEQWQTDYLPTNARRDRVEQLYRRLVEYLCLSTAPSDRTRELMLPATVDALVVMYSDMVTGRWPFDSTTPFARVLERRWRDLERDAAREDPALARILPLVRPRIDAGCALIEQFLTRGYDRDALQAFRAAYSW